MKHVFVDWLEVEAGYGLAINGFEPKNATPYGVVLRVHKPELCEIPAITSDKPWETLSVGSYASFAKVGDKYKCWYEAYTTWDDYHCFLCYAESDDGIHWKKPNLGIVDFKGSRENNIVIETGKDFDHGYSVIYDEEAPEEEKYKMVFSRHVRDENGKLTTIDGQKSIFTFKGVSSDGIHWIKADHYVCIGGDTMLSLVKMRGEYLLYTRAQYHNIIHRRTIAHAVSEDFNTFSRLQIIKDNDPLDNPDTDYYTSGVSKWPGCDVLIQLLPKYHRNSDLIDIYLCESRRGNVFYELSQEPYISCNEFGTFQYGLMPSLGVLDLGNGTWAIHTSSPTHTHNDYTDKESLVNSIYRGIVREDGFVSIYADSYGGFDTMPLDITEESLSINCRLGKFGYVKATIIDSKKDEVVEGFEGIHCNPLERNVTWQNITWNTGKTLKDLDAGRKYRIHFDMFSADIYAYKF